MPIYYIFDNIYVLYGNIFVLWYIKNRPKLCIICSYVLSIFTNSPNLMNVICDQINLEIFKTKWIYM